MSFKGSPTEFKTTVIVIIPTLGIGPAPKLTNIAIMLQDQYFVIALIPIFSEEIMIDEETSWTKSMKSTAKITEEIHCSKIRTKAIHHR